MAKHIGFEGLWIVRYFDDTVGGFFVGCWKGGILTGRAGWSWR
jgi:hypothetical protein